MAKKKALPKVKKSKLKPRKPKKTGVLGRIDFSTRLLYGVDFNVRITFPPATRTKWGVGDVRSQNTFTSGTAYWESRTGVTRGLMLDSIYWTGIFAWRKRND